MANRLKMVQQEVLFSLFEKGWSNRKINKALGTDRRTLARYRFLWTKALKQSGGSDSSPQTLDEPKILIQNTPPKCPPEGVEHFQVPPAPANSPLEHSKSQAHRYHDLILQKLEKGQQARSIYQDLVIEYDYAGSYDSVKRYTRQLLKRSPKLYARIETPPGEEAQVDFGRGAPVLRNGRYFRPWLFVMTLCFSRKSYLEVVWTQDVETFIRCHEHAFQYFGGVPKVIKIDNLKSGVLKAHLYEPTLNPNYLAFSLHCGFAPLPCRVATPQHKGKVENFIQYAQNSVKGKEFASLEAHNSTLRYWNANIASKRIHGTTKRQVDTMFLEEKPSLQPLPATSFALFKIGLRKVNAIDSHIEVAGAYYPVPPIYMGKQVTVHFNSTLVKVFYNDRLIQRLSVVAKGHFHPDKSCLPENKNYNQQRYIQGLFDQCQKLGPSVLAWAKEAEALRDLRAYRAIQGVIALGRKYAADIINMACSQSLILNVFNYHIIKEQAETLLAQQKIQYQIHFLQESELIRSPKEYQELVLGKE